MDSKPSPVSLKRTLFRLDDGTVSLGTWGWVGVEASLLRPEEPVLEYLRDDFNLVIVIGAGVRVTREHCLDCEDNGGRTDKNLFLIEGSGANREGVDNNEVRICKG